ncbi:MAG TPA: hypothetical protein VFF73_15245 [Planctomycetota bacterium]|nr:hypothetical protein [Planctomycetota bacterium]
MRRFIPMLFLFAMSSGCMAVGRVSQLGGNLRRERAEVLTATSRVGEAYAVVALEAECRVTPGDPEGGPGSVAYTLGRTGVSAEEASFLEGRDLTPVAAYARGHDPVPSGFPDAVILGENSDEKAGLFVRAGSGWREVPIGRYVHREAKPSHPVLATVTEVLLLPPALAFDLATFPIQCFLAPWFPILPP